MVSVQLPQHRKRLDFYAGYIDGSGGKDPKHDASEYLRGYEMGLRRRPDAHKKYMQNIAELRRVDAARRTAMMGSGRFR